MVRLQVDLKHTCRLCRIYQEISIRFANDSSDFADRLDGAQDIGCMRHGHQSRARRHRPTNVVWLDRSLSIVPDTRHGHDTGCFKTGKRSIDAIVFQIGCDDVITRPQHAFDGHVQRVGAVEGQSPALDALAMKKLIEAMPAIFQDALRGQRQPMTGSTGVAELFPRTPIHRQIDTLRLGKTRRRIVEINHSDILTPAHLPA